MFNVIVLGLGMTFLLIAFGWKDRSGYYLICLAGLFASVVSFAIGTQAMLALGFGFLCMITKGERKAYIIAACASLIVMCGLRYDGIATAQNRVLTLRRDFPVESLAPRLSYETAASIPVDASTDADTSSSLTQLSPTTRERLHHQDTHTTEGQQTSWRLRSLQRLHDDSYLAFVSSPGFGSMRMARVNRFSLEYEKEPAVELPPTWNSDATAPSQIQVPDLESPVVPLAALTTATGLDFHDQNTNDFLSPERFGHVQSVNAVTGFVPHRISAHKTIDGWKVSQLQLISILRHKTPVAYVSASLPRMDDLVDAQTRPLNTFEMDALSQLQQEDVVVETLANRTRMLGSLRAGKTCMECHSVSEGSLLGAFSYELLNPIAPAALNADQHEKPSA